MWSRSTTRSGPICASRTTHRKRKGGLGLPSIFAAKIAGMISYKSSEPRPPIMEGSPPRLRVGERVLDPQALITRYLPELETTAYREAELRHVLDMTSGVHFSEDYTDPYSDIGKCDIASGWKPPPGPGDFPDNMWGLILTLAQRDRAHGELFSYRSIETDVLAFCMERAAGKRLPELVSELIWQPMGAGASACFTVDRAGYALADGGLNATLRDYARFGAIYLNDGFFNNRQIVPAQWVRATRVGKAGTIWRLLKNPSLR